MHALSSWPAPRLACQLTLLLSLLGQILPLHAETVPVETVRTQVQSVTPMLRTSGTLASRSEQTLSFRVAGLIGAVQVQDGEQVTAGTELARLNAEEIDAELTQAEARLAETLRAVERLARLHGSGVIPLEQLQTAQTAADVARASVQAARFNQRHSIIRAPSDGRVLARYIEPNEMASPERPAFRFSASHSGWVMRLGLSDREVIQVNLGDTAEIRLSAYPERLFSGEVAQVAASASTGTGTFEAEVRLLDVPPDLRLFSGMIGEIRILPGAAVPLLQLPLSALIAVQGQEAEVFVIGSDGRVSRRAVQLAGFDNEHVRIREGLQEGEWVVSIGATRLRQGDRVASSASDRATH